MRDSARRIPGRRDPLTASSVDGTIVPLLSEPSDALNPNIVRRGTKHLRR
jgi:hypothetical protein